VTGLVGSLHYTTDARSIALTLLSTSAVFWIAHVWSELLGTRIETGSAGSVARLRRIAAEEWPMVEAGALPFAALALAWADVYTDSVGVDLALGVAIAQLVGWGLVGARRMDAGWPKSLAVGAIDGAMGLAIVALEIVLH
jgi:hypothetical protein